VRACRLQEKQVMELQCKHQHNIIELQEKLKTCLAQVTNQRLAQLTNQRLAQVTNWRLGQVINQRLAQVTN